MTLRDCDHGRYAAPVHVEAEFRGSVQARVRRVPGRVHVAAQFAGGVQTRGPCVPTRYTWAGSCHGWNSYGTRRPRVCGIPCVSAPRVPAGGMPGTLLPPVYGTPRTGGRRVPRGRPPVPAWPEFRAGVQTRGRCVPARSAASTCLARVYAGPANSARVCTRNPSAVARTRTDLAESCELAADVCRQPAWHEAPAARYPSTAGATPVARISSRAASSSTGTPSCCAFVSFEPAASPATT